MLERSRIAAVMADRFPASDAVFPVVGRPRVYARTLMAGNALFAIDADLARDLTAVKRRLGQRLKCAVFG